VHLRSIVIAFATVAAASTAAAASAPGRLVITGAFRATSAHAASSGYESCGFRSKARKLIYQGEALRIGRGPGVARVEFLIPHYHGRGRYDARIPAPYSRTAVQVVTARNATTGVASGFYIATSGSVSVTQSKNVGRPGRSGSVGGTVHAKLRMQRGSKRLRLDGSWRCRIEPGANGG
jgi:hypothetical protein